jgi:hypothetical protein
MIIKSLSRKSNSGQLVKYALRYSLKQNSQLEKQENAIVLLRHNLRTKTAEGNIKEFKENESYRIYRRKDSVVLFNTILIFAPKDKFRITKEMLKDVAIKFVELRASNCLNLAVAHLEKDHTHVHVLTSGVKVDGKSSRVSKKEFSNILSQLEKYQQDKYPELINSKNVHAKQKVETKEQIIDILQKKRNSKKLSLNNQLEAAYKSAQSQTEFFQNLSTYGYKIYNRNSKPQGVLVDGKKFRFSGLGFDEKRFEELEEREANYKTTLDEIQSIRNIQIKNKEMEIVNTKGDKEEIELESIQSIRRKVKERDGLERGMGNLHERFESENSFDR